jgi:hypothetical protein
MIRRDELDNVDFSDICTGETTASVTPGDLLRHDFMEPLTHPLAAWPATWAQHPRHST